MSDGTKSGYTKTGKKVKSINYGSVDLTYNKIYEVFVDIAKNEFIIDDVGDWRYGSADDSDWYELVDDVADLKCDKWKNDWSFPFHNIELVFDSLSTNHYNPLAVQQSGNHYKNGEIQPIEYSERNNLSMCQGNIVKYTSRHKEKNGVDDLAKVVHYALLEALFVYGEDGATELRDKIDSLINIKNGF